MYEKSFSAISERYFKASPWPSVEAVARFADNDHVFCLLYKEMYFRHVYSKVGRGGGCSRVLVSAGEKTGNWGKPHELGMG